MRTAGSAAWRALRIAAVRLRFVGLVALAALLAASLDDLSALARSVLVRAGPAPVVAAGAYVCPMHPDAVRSAPGTCPVCGMPLRPREPAEATGRVALGDEALRLGGLTFARVERRPLEREVTAPAALEVDERRVVRLSTPVRASVKHLHVAAPGALVRRGEVLVSLEARDLYQFGKELQRGLSSEDPSVVLARQRLLQMGLSEAQVTRLRAGHDPTRLDLLAPLDGVLVSRTVSVGDQLGELAPLATVADLSRLWLMARLAEEDALLVPVGTAVEAELPAVPGVLLRGTVQWVDAALDPQSRTLAVRAEVSNPDGVLRPGMSGRIRVRVPVGGSEPPLVVPASAVVDSGLRQVVWREDAEQGLEPVEVKVAARAGEVYAIASGLKEGDRIVARGAFLLSADQRLRSVPPEGSSPRSSMGNGR